MAINPSSQYPGKTTVPDTEYPLGGARNVTTPGDGTGTPWEAALLNDIFGMQQAFLAAAGLTASGVPDTAIQSQYLQAVLIATGAAVPTVADLVARGGPAGATVRTVAYRNGVRGGGALYLIKTAAQAASDGDVVDGYGNHLMNDGRVAVLQQDEVNALYYGLSINDGDVADNGPALQAAVNEAIRRGTNSLVLPSGRIHISSTVECLGVNKEFHLQGEPGCEVVTRGFSKIRFLADDPTYFDAETLGTDANLLDAFFVSSDPSKYTVGQAISFRSQQAVDDDFNYIAQGTYVVSGISGNNIYLDRKLRFNFNVADSAVVYILGLGLSASVRNINFTQLDAAAGSQCIQFVYMTNVLIENCTIDAENIGGQEDGVGFDRCAYVTVNNFLGKRLRYPIIVVTGYHMLINNIFGDVDQPPRHLVDFNSWFEYGVVDGFGGTCREGGVNSHPAFDVTYKNGSTLDLDVISNNRWFGGGMQNVSIVASENCGPSGFYSGVIMKPGLYPDYTDTLKSLGLLAFFDAVTIDDTRRPVTSYQGRGFNIGMPGTFQNITHIQPEDGSFTVETYIEQRSLDLKLGDFSEDYFNNRSGVELVVQRLVDKPVNAIQDDVDPFKFHLNRPSMNVQRLPVGDRVPGVIPASIRFFGKITDLDTVLNPSTSIVVSMLLSNHLFRRANTQRFRVKFKLLCWGGIAEKTIQIYNQSSSYTATLVDEFLSVSGTGGADISINSITADTDFPNNETVPVLIDLNITNTDPVRAIRLEYEVEGWESGS